MEILTAATETTRCDRTRFQQSLSASVNLVVRTHGFQQKGIGTVMFDELEDDAQVVPCAGRPRACQLPFQLMRFEPRLKRIFGQQFQSDAQILRRVRILAREPLG